MAQFPGMTLWTDALMADTDHLSDAEFGRYMRLLILMWRTPGCRIPANDAWLCKHLRLPSAERGDRRKSLKTKGRAPNSSCSTALVELHLLISEFCQNDGNWITQKRLSKEFKRAFERSGRLKSLNKKRRTPNRSRSTGAVEQEMHGNPLSPKEEERKKERASGESPAKPGEKQENGSGQQSPRSLATAPPSGALTRSAQTEQAEQIEAIRRKRPDELTLPEINLLQGWAK